MHKEIVKSEEFFNLLSKVENYEYINGNLRIMGVKVIGTDIKLDEYSEVIPEGDDGPIIDNFFEMEITIGDIPSTSMSGINEFTYIENPNPVFDMSWDCMVNYYVKLFENRTNENKQYIHRYPPIKGY